MVKPVIIIGGDGHAKVLIDALKLFNFEILGILDNDPENCAINGCMKLIAFWIVNFRTPC
jgi:hypothetical protein